MNNWLSNRLGLKIISSVFLVVFMAMWGIIWFVVSEQTRQLEAMMFANVRNEALVGASNVSHQIEQLVNRGDLTAEEVFDTDYQLILSGPLAGTDPPKYHTAYDQLFDSHLHKLQDRYLENEAIVYAVLVDRNGYLPVHNLRYSNPLTGDMATDLSGNRTKRIFNDPVGLKAARFTGEEKNGVLRQIYHRDTGVKMWDVTAPVYLFGKHWGGFRLGLSIEAMEVASYDLARSYILSSGVVFLFCALTIFYLVQRAIKPLALVSQEVEQLCLGHQAKRIHSQRKDEIGQLVDSFNKLTDNLEKTSVSRDYLDRILGSMHDSLLVIDPSGVVKKTNTACCELLGYSREQLVGKHFAELLAIDQQDNFDWFDTIIEARDGALLELCYQTATGDSVPVILSSAPLISSQGEPQGLICVAQDNSERLIAQEKIQSAHNFLKKVLNSLTEEMMILNPEDLSIIKVNQAFLTAYETTEEQVVGKKCYQVTHGVDSPCQDVSHYCPAQDTLQFGSIESCVHEHLDADCNKRYVEIQVTPVMDKQDECQYLIHMARDITVRKRAEGELQRFNQQLEQKNLALEEKTLQLNTAHEELKKSHSQILQQEKMASIGQLSAGVAHEINNPIGFVSSNLVSLGKYARRLTDFIDFQESHLLEHLDDTANESVMQKRKKMKIDRVASDIHELIDESMEGADRVRKIVFDLKGFSRVDEIDCKRVDIHECLESTLNIARNEIKYKAEVEKNYGELADVECYPQQINQVFMNLLVNAAHAIDESGTISIKTWNGDGRAHISISDTGCGIPLEIQPRIFEPFYTTKEVGKGTGLGLSISYDIIKKHRGDITLESALGKGTTFTVHLPFEHQGEAPC